MQPRAARGAPQGARRRRVGARGGRGVCGEAARSGRARSLTTAARDVDDGAATADTQWPLWEVFTQRAQGAPHEHAGSVHAADAEHALQNARDVYARRGEGGEHLGRAERRDHRVDARRRGTVLRSGQRQGRTGIRSSTRCRAACASVMSTDGPAARRPTLFEYLLRLGDDRLVLGHRLSEWCGHGPILEEDIALANIALDLIGQATLLLQAAPGEVEGEGPRRRRARVLPRRDRVPQRADRRAAEGRLRASRSSGSSSSACYALLAARSAVSAAANADARRHRREGAQGGALPRAPQRASGCVTLGDGTDGESRARAARARRAVALHRRAVRRRRRRSRRGGAGHRRRSARARSARGARMVRDVLARATLTLPADGYMQRGGRAGPPHRAPRPHARRDADRRALASGGDVVSARSPARPTSDAVLAILDTVMDPGGAGAQRRRARHRARRRGRRRRASTVDDHADVLGLSRDARDRARHRARAATAQGIGRRARFARRIRPAWTTDWIGPRRARSSRPTASRRRAARPTSGAGSARAVAPSAVRCPYCDSRDTESAERVRLDGVQGDLLLHACRQPFEEFKAI